MSKLRDSYTIKLTASDKELVEVVLNSHDFPFDEKTFGNVIFRAITEVAYDKSKPKEVDTPQTLQKLKELETEINDLKLSENEAHEKAAEYSKSIDRLNSNQIPEGAIVLNYPSEKQEKLKDLLDMCKIQNIAKSYEELFIICLETIQEAGALNPKESDYAQLKEKRSKNEI